MPRIRTVKPDLWTDEKLAQISRDARLLFIALFNFADDYGTAKGHPVFLKNQIFPYDNISLKTFEGWLRELVQIGVIIPFSQNDEKYIFIKNFQKHQVINRPSKNRFPQPPDDILTEHSRSTHGAFTEHSVKEKEREKERKGKEEKEDGAGAPATHPLQKFISENLKNVSQMRNQLTFQEAERLANEFPKDAIREVLEAMENTKKLTQKYISVNLTLRNWLKIRGITPKTEKKTVLVSLIDDNGNGSYVSMPEAELKEKIKNGLIKVQEGKYVWDFRNKGSPGEKNSEIKNLIKKSLEAT